MKIAASFAALLVGLLTQSSHSGERPANSDVAVDDSFAREQLGKEWNTTTGNWRIVDGVLRGSEVPADRHSAATRRVVDTRNAVYELRSVSSTTARPSTSDSTRPVAS